MNYQVTARKYRPQSFTQLIGQDHVSKTILNAIKSNRVSHAYLFSGPRGVGKTSMARLIAKSLNCEKGPTTEPCNTCKLCQAINNNTSLDFHEIDGASNRGIDQIRELQESLKYSPVNSKYKIYIIDEVHMLTIEAFNALLKSLEEPPEKVIFILCTTEPYKIPLTIKSRCQQYFFRAIPINTIVEKLKEILNIEKIKYDEDALFYIARAANGSLRDSESILDQIIAYSQNNITKENVFNVLGINSFDGYFSIIDNIIKQNTSEIIKIFYGIYLDGKDIKQFLFELFNIFKNILLIKEGIKDINIIELSEKNIEILSEYAESFNRKELFLILDLFENIINEIKLSLNPKLLIENFLIKLSRYKNLISNEMLLKKVNELSNLTGKKKSPQN